MTHILNIKGMTPILNIKGMTPIFTIYSYMISAETDNISMVNYACLMTGALRSIARSKSYTEMELTYFKEFVCEACISSMLLNKE